MSLNVIIESTVLAIGLAAALPASACSPGASRRPCLTANGS
jgi:hypothetical protein